MQGRYAKWEQKRGMAAAVGLIFFNTLCIALLLVALENYREDEVVGGSMPETAQEQLEEELNSQVSEHMIAMSINSNPVFPDGYSKGNLMFENPSRNGKLIRLKLYRDDTGEIIYETGLLKPGSYVAEDKLDVKLGKGNYQCTALISAYRMEDQSYIGEIAAGITVIIER